MTSFLCRRIVIITIYILLFFNHYTDADTDADIDQVMDLAEGHLAALRYVEHTPTGRGGGHGLYSVFNLGTGKGYSVLEMVEAMKKASGRPLPYVLGPR